MTTTTHLGIELLAAGQHQPETTINDAIVALDDAVSTAQTGADEAALLALALS